MIFWSPSQTADEFHSLIVNLENFVTDMSSRSTRFVLITGNFNVKYINWSINDTTTSKGAQLYYLTTLCDLKNLITEPTHILENSFRCIDLIFTSQLNLVLDYRVHPTLHSNGHHQNNLIKYLA